MAKQWFRWYKDTSSDAKFKMIAMDVSSYGADDPTYGRNVQPAEVVGVWACILERADDDTGIVTVCSPLHNGGAVTAYVGSALDLEGIVAHRIVQSMVEHGLLVNEGEVYRIKNWQSRQYVDATNAERQARFRRNRSNGVTVTPTETETETDSKNQIRPKEATDGLDALFDDFWKVYPRREAKGGARLAFRRAMKRAAFAEIMAGARLYAAQRAGKEKQYTAMAQTWLNQDRWLDEAAAPQQRPVSMPRWADVRYDYEQKYGKKQALSKYTEDMNALVCGDGKAQEGTSGQPKSPVPGV